MFLIAILADWVGAVVGGKKMVGYLGLHTSDKS